jgi:ribA/ribD-fused uncharacterized protein
MADVTAQNILSATDPRKPDDQWLIQAEDVLSEALRHKFQQNPDLLQYLLKTEDRVLGEASKNTDFSVGLSLGNPQVMDHHVWTGKNWLGQDLMKIRQELK